MSVAENITQKKNKCLDTGQCISQARVLDMCHISTGWAKYIYSYRRNANEENTFTFLQGLNLLGLHFTIRHDVQLQEKRPFQTQLKIDRKTNEILHFK